MAPKKKPRNNVNNKNKVTGLSTLKLENKYFEFNIDSNLKVNVMPYADFAPRIWTQGNRFQPIANARPKFSGSLSILHAIVDVINTKIFGDNLSKILSWNGVIN